jgi:cytochrome c-type biogenesis protein CcmE
MTPTRKRRLYAILSIVVGVAATVALALTAFQENLLYYFSPSEVHAGEVPQGRNIRVGGMVVQGSVDRPGQGLTVKFVLTDYAQEVTVEYEGILPDLFREGQGIIAQGKLDERNTFVASEVLAKHDENYLPPEVADSLKMNHQGMGSKQDDS